MTRPPFNGVDGGNLRISKYVGFLGMGLGTLLIVGAAILPVSPASQRLGPFRIDIQGENCGPAALVAVDDPNTDCQLAARKRVVITTAVGLLVVAAGMALFVGSDGPRGSRIQVPTRTVKRQPALRNPGSRRYRPG
jgi:hypothetical protein